MPESDDRTIGRIEGRMDGLDDRLQRLENDFGRQLAGFAARLDEQGQQIGRLVTALAEQKAGRIVWRWLGGALIGASGWVALAVELTHGAVR